MFSPLVRTCSLPVRYASDIRIISFVAILSSKGFLREERDTERKTRIFLKNKVSFGVKSMNSEKVRLDSLSTIETFFSGNEELNSAKRV